MNNLHSESEISKYIDKFLEGDIEWSHVPNIFSFPYNDKVLRDKACKAFTNVLSEIHNIRPQTLDKMAVFLETSDYFPALQPLINHRNKIQNVVDQEESGYLDPTGNKRKVLLVLNNVISSLKVVKRHTPKLKGVHALFKYDVFLSYATKDSKHAQDLYSKIHHEGFKVYFSEKTIVGGDNFSDNIRDALVESAELWVLITPNSLHSEWVTTEWGAAWGLGKRIVPILLQCSHEALPNRLKLLQCADYHEIDRLIEQLSGRQESKSKDA